MANQYFQFRKFRVCQEKCGMKVGTDGVLLGAWCGVSGRRRILDVGTGTGLIALMLAQRNEEALLDALELDADACSQAADNFADSPWQNRIQLIASDFVAFAAQNAGGVYDLIVSNPPYFENSLKACGAQRTQARHTDTLPFESLLAGASHLLREEGVLALIYPIAADERIEALAGQHGLKRVRKTEVRGTATAAPKRVLTEFQKTTASLIPISTELVVEEARHCYTDAFKALTEPFYLKR